MTDWETVKEQRRRRKAERRAGGQAGVNPYPPLVADGLFNRSVDIWEKELAALDGPAHGAPGTDPSVAVRRAWGLRYTFQLTAAEKAFRAVLDAAPETPGADLGHFLTLQNLARFDEAVSFGLKTWPDGANRGFCHRLSEGLLNLGNVDQARELEDQWLFLRDVVGEVWELRARIAATLGQWTDAAEGFGHLLKVGVTLPKIQAQFLWAMAAADAGADVADVEQACADALGAPMPAPNWARYQLCRWAGCRDAAALAAEPELPIVLPTDFESVMVSTRWNLNLLDAAGEADYSERTAGALTAPVIEPAALRGNIGRFRDGVAGLVAEGRFEKWTGHVAAVRAEFAASSGRPPVFVLSTGRCGTLALLRLAERSANVTGYHTLLMYLSNVERNHMLYRIIEGQFDKQVVGDLVQAYLEVRMTEILYAFRHHRAPLIVNHLDTVFAPAIAEVFPDSRFLHLHRDETATYRSFLTKNQWGGQLQHFRYDAAFPDGRFVHRRDARLTPEAHIAWYLHVTRVFADAFAETLDAGRIARVRSEDLFARNQDALGALRAVLPIDDISDADYRAHYAAKINEKAFRVDPDLGDMDAREAEFRAVLACLRDHGTPE